jgi:hypothetical protein
LEAQDFTVTPTKNGHYKVHNSEGNFVATIEGTSSDWRGEKNTLSALRRAGFEDRRNK